MTGGVGIVASVLMFNISDPEKVNLIRVLSIRLNFACRTVPPDRQGCLIRDLLDRGGDSPVPGKPFYDEMLVMDGFSHPDLNFLLNELIRTGHTIRLKAVVTQTNEKWTAGMLHAQLLSEDRDMHRKA